MDRPSWKEKKIISKHISSQKKQKKTRKTDRPEENGAAKTIPAELREKLCALKNTKEKKKKWIEEARISCFFFSVMFGHSHD